MECKKCKAPGSVILRKKDCYCAQCFITNTNHKFRSCIGKNRILSSNEKVLIGVSGGTGSTVLLDFVHEGVTLSTHKILKVTPVCVHVTELEETVDVTNAILKQCKHYGFDVYIIPLSESDESGVALPAKNSIPSVTQADIQKFCTKWKKHSNTSWNNLMVKLKRKIFIQVANALHCNYIFTAETTTRLASNLLSNLAMGRGSQIEHDIGFADSRDETVKILRPMKDINQEELDQYVSLKNLTPLHKNNCSDKSLQSLVETFVVDLQKNFPATISTVCKTSEKIGTYEHNTKLIKCSFCQSDINVKNCKLTALQAINFSQAVCHGKPETVSSPDSHSPDANKITNLYCYACKRNQGLM